MSSESIAVHSVVVNSTPTDGGNGPGRPDDLARFAASARVDDAIRDRRRRQHLTSRALDEVDTVRTLLGAVDHHVTVHLAAATATVSGTVYAVGRDVVELHAGPATWWVALGAVGAVETDGALLGDPADQSDTGLHELLAGLVDSAVPVTVVLSSGASVVGEVVAAGAALVLTTDRPEHRTVVALEHIAAISRPSSRR
jgi:hypothetical protein